MIPPSFIQDLLSRTDIVEIVGRHVTLKKAGINHQGLCPFHSEKSPSFNVSPSRQTYHCFGCGAHGNALGFLMEHAGMGFIDAVKDLAQQVGMQVPEEAISEDERARRSALKKQQSGLSELLAKAAEHYKRQLKADARAVAYLKGRGLSGQIAARYGLGYAPSGWRFLSTVMPDYADKALEESGLVIASEGSGVEGNEGRRYDRFRDRIMFPIRNVTGEVIGFGGRVIDQGDPKYLNSPETPVFSKGQELYGLHEARSAIRSKGYALVVEGYMDVVALAQHGFGNAVATLGTACTAEHVQKLFRFTESVVFSFDGDAAGRRAAGRALEASLPHAKDTRQIRFLFLPAEHDPDSYVRELGAEAFDAAVQAAVPLSKQLIEVARDGKDLATMEGRALFLNQAQPLWSALPDGTLKLQLLAELARMGGMDVVSIEPLWRQAQAKSRARAARRNAEPVAERVSGRAASRQTMASNEEGVALEHTFGPSDGSEGAEPDHSPWFERPKANPTGRRPEGTASGWGGSASSAAKRTGKFSKGFQPPPAQPPLRKRPPGPADHVMRLLLLNSHWLEALSAEDLALLQQLPSPHRDLCAWLEREVMNAGPRPWAVLEPALRASGLAALMPPTIDAHALQDEAHLKDLQRLIDGLRLDVIASRQQALIASASSQPEALKEWREIETQRLALLLRMQERKEGDGAA